MKTRKLTHLGLFIVSAAAAHAQNDWPVYGRDGGGMRYSPLVQIDIANVSRRHRAWTYHTGDSGTQFETTPIVAGNRMYLFTQPGRASNDLHGYRNPGNAPAKYFVFAIGSD